MVSTGGGGGCWVTVCVTAAGGTVTTSCVVASTGAGATVCVAAGTALVVARVDVLRGGGVGRGRPVGFGFVLGVALVAGGTVTRAVWVVPTVTGTVEIDTTGTEATVARRLLVAAVDVAAGDAEPEGEARAVTPRITAAANTAAPPTAMIVGRFPFRAAGAAGAAWTTTGGAGDTTGRNWVGDSSAGGWPGSTPHGASSTGSASSPQGASLSSKFIGPPT